MSLGAASSDGPASSLEQRPARVGGLRRGYRVREVDLFVDHLSRAVPAGRVTSAQVRAVGFGSQLGGYDVDATDALLAELEDRLVRRERNRARGVDEQQWAQRQAALSAAVHGRLGEPSRERFPRARGVSRGYRPRDVDAMCDLLAEHLRGGPRLQVGDVRGVLFRPRRGRRGYREAPVDAFLDRVVELMVAFDR
ncbi:MAG: DivIVA domain-containing protein [Janthinobacterium lividum]